MAYELYHWAYTVFEVGFSGATENASPVKCNTMKMMDQIAALEFARPGKWRTKSHSRNLQDLENEGPNRRGWRMQDQFDFKK